METIKTTKRAPVILPGVIYSQLKETYTFKEITETEELEKAFRLRYEVYSNSKLRNFLKQDKNRIDIDSYDLHSRHFGLYLKKNKLIGYIRLVLDRNDFYNIHVFEVGERLGLLTKSNHSHEAIKKLSVESYPFLSYPNVPESIQSFHQIATRNNEGLIEASRLVIKEEHRGLLTSIFLIECVIAQDIFNFKGQKHAVVSCRKEHSSIYKRYGFNPIGDGNVYYPDKSSSKLPVLSFSLKISLPSVPQKFHSKFENMANEYSKTGKITRAI